MPIVLTPNRRPSAVVALAVAALLLGGCSPAPEPSPPAAGTAAEQLAALPVKGRAPKTGYSREAFGDGWVDTDRNGCDTRNDVLARDLTEVRFRPGTRDCVVASGTLADPYGGGTVAFVRGEGTSDAVQIDHVVALSNAWQTGAQQWDADRRARFANDPLELLAVDGPLNSAKGDGDAATWLPPNTGFRCAYVARQVAVKAAYGLWVTPAERDAVARVLATCPDQPVAQASPSAAGGDGTDPRFASCREAREAGRGPYVAGTDPEYDWYRDADGDGRACD
ncbi:GmrSD restriction endonuclease domain-containing protein [Kineococcus sp. SYSU DK002]|uniref:GmrSD restriction endonuclease domain-containing protein n=1 Tax=Kineococcus sp. SYSU DK002 TaxID=3383123 RepID=UPI003D7C81C6